MGTLSTAKSNVGMTGSVINAHTKYLREKNKADDSHRDGKLHPSMVSGCPTAATIGILLLEDAEHDGALLRIFGLGTAIHQLLQAELYEAGLIATLNNGKPAIEVPLEMPEYDLVGHADGIVWIRKDGVAVLEIKSINSMAFAKLTEPKPEHKIQAACYVMALAKELNGSKEVCFIYYSKNDSKMKEFIYTVTPADEAYVIDRIHHIQRLIAEFKANPEAPEPFYKKASENACRYCSYKRNCHDSFYRVDWNKRLKEKYGAIETPTKKSASEVKAQPKKRGLGKVVKTKPEEGKRNPVRRSLKK